MPIDKEEQESSGRSPAKAMWGIVIVLAGSVLLALVLGVWAHWIWRFFQIGWDYVD